MNKRNKLLLLGLTILIVMPMVVNQISAGPLKGWVAQFSIYDDLDYTSSNVGLGDYQTANNKIETEYDNYWGIYRPLDRAIQVQSSAVWGVRLHIKYNHGDGDASSITVVAKSDSTHETYYNDYDDTEGTLQDATLSSTWEHGYIDLGEDVEGDYIAVHVYGGGCNAEGEWIGIDFIYLEIYTYLE